MENMDALLAAAAQTPDDAAAEVGVGKNSASSAVVREVSGEVGPSVAVAVPPPAPEPALDGAGEKRRRGRYGKLVVRPPAPKRVKPEEEEDEDVCFICFDGGSMVLCDRKGCPKAYHPACIKRDEAFFQSTARWFCGWHICSVCRKASHYLCYTCSYSLCKKCIKDADYSCVRRNKGFCSTCMKTIMLLENKGQANNESIQVDFDDKTSWEYLFKVYWVVLKEKLSLTLDELTRAQKPCKDLGTIECKPLSSNVIPNAVKAEVPISDRSTEHSESNKSHMDIDVNKINNEDTAKPIMDEKATDTPCIKDKATNELEIEKSQVKAGIDQNTKKKSNCKNTDKKEPEKPGTDSCSSSSTEWATRDLLEFVAHMKNGDTSALSQFDVQMLLLDYIKKNNLRDPRRKGQIICDQRLKNLFGKPRAGHIEMLKLLESHFVVEDSKKSSFIPAGLVSSTVKSEMSDDGDTYEPPMPIKSRKRKMCKKIGEKAPTQNNLKEYAAIDVHNINLVYLQRNLMENLLEDRENFDNKVIGSIVRIKILSSDQKQDVHRLVQVVGTTKVGEPYKTGDRTTDVMLEVLNLDKKEVVSIDAISNHEFTEDECRRLRQSIRCGLVKQFTVGEVQNKAMALQPVRVNDCLEAEILRLNHLRDRASENGRKKELREYVEKLQLLKSPEERSRRISKIPEIHSDPKMSPNYESEEDTKSADNVNKEYVRSSYSRVPQNGRKSISRNKKDNYPHLPQNGRKSKMVTGGRNNHAMRSSGVETSTETASVGNLPLSSVIETEKFWHYCDPSGKIQGPFSMMQLRKWSTTGLFPPDMRIWTNHEQHDSVLLTDAFNGKFNLASNSSDSGAKEEKGKATEEVGLVNEITNVSIGDSKQTEEVGLVNEITNVSIGDSKQKEEVGLVNEITNVSIGDSKQKEEVGLVNEITNVSIGDGKQTEEVRNEITNVSIGDSKQTEEVGLVNEITNVSIGDGKQTEEVGLVNEITNVSIGDGKQTEEVGLVNETTNVSIGDSEQTEPALALGSNNNASISSERLVRADETTTSPCPQSRDLLKDSKSNSDVDDQTRDLPSSNLEKKNEDFQPQQNGENNSEVVTVENPILTNVPELPNRSNTEVGLANEEKLRAVNVDVECGPPSSDGNLSLLGLPSPTPKTVEIDQLNVPMQNFEILEQLSPKPKHNEDELATSEFINFTDPNSGQIWSGASEVNLPEAANEWCGYSPTPTQPPLTIEDVLNSTPNEPNWRMTINEPIELDALSEESVSDLLAEVDAMNMREASFPSHTFMKFARELMEDDDDCFSSIEFSRKSETFTSNSGVQSTPEPKPVNNFDFPTSSSVVSSLSSEGKVGVNVGPVVGSESVDPGWCTTVQGNINLVTVQGDVNLVLGQGMWGNPNMNPSPRSLQWERQRMYGSPREWGRSPWGRQQQYGGYSRQVPKGQRVCKFYEGGRCKKGAFCDYLHP